MPADLPTMNDEVAGPVDESTHLERERSGPNRRRGWCRCRWGGRRYRGTGVGDAGPDSRGGDRGATGTLGAGVSMATAQPATGANAMYEANHEGACMSLRLAQ